MLLVIMLGVSLFFCCAECRYIEFHNTEYHYTECHGTAESTMLKLPFMFLCNNDYSSIINIYTSVKHSLLFFKLLALALNSLDTLSDIRIKVFTLLF